MPAVDQRHPDAGPRTALVTGGARRIGKAIVEQLVADGWSVAVHFRRSREAALALVQSLDRTVGDARVLAVQADLACENEVEGLIAQVTDLFGPLGCLINNASVFEQDGAVTATRESWARHLEPNLRAPFVLAQGLVRSLPGDQGGAIVNLIDQRVFNPTPHFTSYSLSKSALWSLTQSLALALAPQVRVNAIAPGPTLPSTRQSAEDFALQCAALPLGRGPTPEEIASAVRFVLASKSMTGQAIVLDGGQHLGWVHPKPGEVVVE